MQMLDNITEFVKDDLQKEIKPGCRVSIAAAYFSIYAYQELKEQLSGCKKRRNWCVETALTHEKTSYQQGNANPFEIGSNVLTTGFDAPNTDCAVLLRTTNSAGLYVQTVGRSTRLRHVQKLLIRSDTDS